MSRFISLIKMMGKTKNKIIAGDDNNNKHTDIVLKIVLAAIVFGISFYGGIKAADFFEVIESVISLNVLLKIIFMAFVVIVICITLVSIINTLYMSDELMLLLTMPFTEVQIVAAALYREIKKSLIVAFCVMFPFEAAFGVVLNKTAVFYIVICIASLLLPIITVCIVASLIMIVFRIFGVFRNRNFLKFFGLIIVLAGYIAYTFLTNGSSNENTFTEISKLKDVVNYIPGIYHIGCMLEDFSIVSFLILLGITVVSVAVVLLLAKTIYINVALSMKNCSGKSKKMSEKSYVKNNKPTNIIVSIMKKEIKMTLRCPAYLINGYLITYLLPVIVIVMILVEGKASDGLSGLNINADNLAQVSVMMFLSVLYTLFIVGNNSIVRTPISREGNYMLLIKQMPLSFKTIIQGKLSASLLITGIPTIGYMLVAGIVMSVMNIMDVVCMIYVVVINITALVLLVNITTFLDAKNPNLDWSSETDMLKGKYIARFMWIIVAIVLTAIAVGAIIVIPSIYIAAIAILAVNIILDVLTYILVTRAGAHN